MILGHIIALDPTKKQANMMARAIGCARKAYNWGLVEWNRQYHAGLKPNANKVKKAFNEIKEKEFPWIYDSPKDANQQAFADLGNGFQRFFKSVKGTGPKAGHPRKHKKGRNDSFYLSNTVFRFHADGKRVYLPKIGSVKIHESLRFEGKIIGARVKRKGKQWYLSVQVESEARVPNAHIRPIIGVDLGLKTAIYPSKGNPVDAPKPLKQDLAKLRRANKSLHRKKKGSNNRYKARMKLAKVHKRIANVRHDFMHKVTTQLVRENQTIVIEDLHVQGMLRNHKFARAISDVGFGLFRRLLEYKALIYNSNIIVADRWFPSSKRCSNLQCGFVKEALSLSERVFICEKCGLTIDRDENASLNLEQYPALQENWDHKKSKTPIEIGSSTRLVLSNQASSIVEIGIRP